MLKTPGAANLGQAVWQATQLEEFPKLAPGKKQALWILHDDSAPAPTCLAQQVKSFESGESIKVVGAKQRLWDKAKQIVEVGIQATRSGRRLQEMDTGEIDQGQYDFREDVLGVGSAGMLVDWDVFRELEGFDPVLGPYGDGLEFSRRVHLAGYRVVVAPKAVIYHKMAGYFGLRGPDGGRAARSTRSFDPTGRDIGSNGKLEADPKRSFTARRLAQLHNWIVAAPTWLVVFLPLIILLLGLMRFVWRILTKEPKLAAGELKSTFLTIFKPLPAWRARRQLRQQSKQSPRTLRPLQIKGSKIRQAKTTARRVAKDQRKPQIPDARARRNFHIEKSLDRTLVWIVFAALTLISLLGWRFGLGGIAGGAMPNLPAVGNSFWADLVSGWIPSGLGYGSAVGVADPLGLILAALGQLAGLIGLRGSLVLALLLFATMPLAWLSAWWATGVLTDSRPLRTLAALSWALSPNLLASLGVGQIPVWVLALAIPLFVGSLGRAAGMSVRRTLMGEIDPVTVNIHSAAIIQAGIAGLSGFLAVAASVMMVIPLLILVLLALIKGVSNPLYLDLQAGSLDDEAEGNQAMRYLIPPRLRLKLTHFLIVLLPSVLLALPTLIRTLSTPALWPLWLSSLSVPTPTPAPSWWDLLTAWPLGLSEMTLSLAFPGWRFLAYLPVLLLLLAVVAGLILPAKGTGSQWGVIFALLGLGAAWLSSSTIVSVSSSTPVSAWAGPGLAVFHAGLITAMLFSVGRLKLTTPSEVASWGNKTAKWALVVAVLIPLVGATPMLTSQIVSPAKSGFNAVKTFHESNFPATVAQGQSSPLQQRALYLEVHEAPNQSVLVTASLWRGWRDTVYEASPYLKLKNYRNITGERTLDKADTALENTVASVLGGPTPELGEKLAQLAVNFIIVPPGTDSTTVTLVNTLDSAAMLERVTTTEAGTIWRLDKAIAAGRARTTAANWQGGVPLWPTEKVSAEALEMVNGTAQIPNGEGGRLLALSERADASFQVNFNGKAIEPVDSGQWNALYQLPPGSGTLTVSYAYLPYQLWGIAVLVVLFIAFAAALPLRRVAEVRL